jgi:glycosyltransferase involved in cell wall biosynthesis
MLPLVHMRILAPTRYAWDFNGPRRSRHVVERRNFLPFNWISKKVEGATVFNPWPPRRFDLIHAFNRIPLCATPFIIGFESHLPRAYGLEHTQYFRELCRMLAGSRCRGLIAISQHARNIFQETHLAGHWRDTLESKLSVRFPNVEIPDCDDCLEEGAPEPLIVSFVGNHFGRKGGCVALRLAQMAMSEQFPLQINIISSMQVGGSIWTDPISKSFFDRYFALLQLPNVNCRGALENSRVLELLRRSHFLLLTTLGDTFGYSAIESMANWTPVIGTRQGALPEFVRHGENGILVDLPITRLGEWVHSSSPHRASKRFEAIFAETVEMLAIETFHELKKIVQEPRRLAQMRQAARQTAIARFDSRSATEFWDELYMRAIHD